MAYITYHYGSFVECKSAFVGADIPTITITSAILPDDDSVVVTLDLQYSSLSKVQGIDLRGAYPAWPDID